MSLRRSARLRLLDAGLVVRERHGEQLLARRAVRIVDDVAGDSPWPKSELGTV